MAPPALGLVARLLPQPEWGRLVGTELGHLAALAEAEPINLIVLVIEDEGTIVGCWSRMLVEHVEGLWVAESHRKRVAVGRLLLNTMSALLRSDNVTQVVTSSVSEEVDQMLEKIGGQPIPGRAWNVPVPEV